MSDLDLADTHRGMRDLDTLVKFTDMLNAHGPRSVQVLWLFCRHPRLFWLFWKVIHVQQALRRGELG